LEYYLRFSVYKKIKEKIYWWIVCLTWSKQYINVFHLGDNCFVFEYLPSSFICWFEGCKLYGYLQASNHGWCWQIFKYITVITILKQFLLNRHQLALLNNQIYCLPMRKLFDDIGHVIDAYKYLMTSNQKYVTPKKKALTWSLWRELVKTKKELHM
jgi:hypothetical protein